MPHPVPPAVVRLLCAALGPTGPTDADLLGRFRRTRDEAAFELLVWRHAPAVLRVCRLVLRDHHAAEDAAQAAFLVLARKAETVREPDAVGGWLLRVAHRIAVRAARRRPPTPRPLPDLLPAPPSVAPDADLSRAVHEELARLRERDRLPVVLCFLEGLSHAEAGRRLGWPTGTVSGRLARAKETLRDRLTRRGVTLPATLAAAGTVGPGFAGATARAAAAFAAGRGVGGVSVTVLQLAKGTVMAMTVVKLQWLAGVAAVAGAVALGGPWAAGQGPGGRPKAEPPAVAVKAVPAKPKGRVADFRQRQTSLNNLRQITQAIHLYHDVHGHLPADIRDKDGKPLLSWRVAILPYLEQKAMYQQLKLDEPWDSEHNAKLLRWLIPRQYNLPLEGKSSTDTPYQVFTGTGTPFDPNFKSTEPEFRPGVLPDDPAAAKRTVRTRVNIPDITDGTVNTLGVVEGGPPVPWTKPADIAYDPKKPAPHVEWPFANVIHAATLDGSVHFLTPDLEKSPAYRPLITIAGREVIDLSKVEAVLPAGTAEEKEALRELIDGNSVLIADIRELMTKQVDLMKALSEKATDFNRAEQAQAALKRLAADLEGQNNTFRYELGRPTVIPKDFPKKP